MDRPGDSQKPPRPSSPSYKTLYLILYNFVSTVLWSTVLGRVALISLLHGHGAVYPGTGQFTKWTQTLAALEVLHSVTGLVRAPLMTTAMQVASRFLLVWGIVNTFPATTAPLAAYASMLIAWSTTEVIRYSYFALNLATGEVPAALTWLRYNTFFVLYPLGISSECWLIYNAIEPTAKAYPGAEYALMAILAIYVPGSYILFTHMMAQRRKVVRGNAGKKSQ